MPNRTGLMYEPADIPREVNGQPVLAFAPMLSYTPREATVPSGVLARVIVPGRKSLEFTMLSIVWQVDSGTWYHDGTMPSLTYSFALTALTSPRVFAGEFGNSI